MAYPEKHAVVREEEALAYVKITAVLATIAAIIGLVVPVAGVLFITPLAIIFGAITLYGGDFKSLGLCTLIIIIVNLVISPTFWANVAVGSEPGGEVNRFLTYFNVIGVIAMLALLARRRKTR